MDHFDEISVKKMQDALDNVEGKKPTERLLATIAYKNGVTQTELAEWYDVQRRTIYSWLERLISVESLEQTIIDATGLVENVRSQNYSKKRSKKLFTSQLKKLETKRRRGRRRSPTTSRRNVRRRILTSELSAVLKEAGVSYQKPRRTAVESDEYDQKEFTASSQKAAGDGRHRSLHRSNQEIRASRVACRAETTQHAALRRTSPGNAIGRVCMARSPRTVIASAPGSPSTSRRTREHFILALCEEFEYGLIVVLDGAPYFQASAVTDLAARDDLVFVTLSSHSTELNPGEECWRQLQSAPSNRFFDSTR